MEIESLGNDCQRVLQLHSIEPQRCHNGEGWRHGLSNALGDRGDRGEEGSSRGGGGDGDGDGGGGCCNTRLTVGTFMPPRQCRPVGWSMPPGAMPPGQCRPVGWFIPPGQCRPVGWSIPPRQYHLERWLCSPGQCRFVGIFMSPLGSSHAL